MKKILALVLSIFSLSSIASTDPKTAYSMVENNEAVIIDVREEDELKGGMIKDAKWFPLSRVLNDKDWKEDFEKITEGKKIFLHCRSGARSEKFMNILKENGIESENIGGYQHLKKVLPTREVGYR